MAWRSAGVVVACPDRCPRGLGSSWGSERCRGRRDFGTPRALRLHSRAERTGSTSRTGRGRHHGARSRVAVQYGGETGLWLPLARGCNGSGVAIGVRGRVAGGCAGLRGIRRASPRDFVGSEELRRGTSWDQKSFAAGLRGIRRTSPRDFEGSEEFRRGTSRDVAGFAGQHSCTTQKEFQWSSCTFQHPNHIHN